MYSIALYFEPLLQQAYAHIGVHLPRNTDDGSILEMLHGREQMAYLKRKEVFAFWDTLP